MGSALEDLEGLPGDLGRHPVHFYRTEAGLAAAVASYLGAALALGETVLQVSTPSHQRLVEAGLEQVGIDVAAMRAAGRLHSRDSRELLSTCLAGGLVDRGRFRASVGAVLDGVGTPSSLYGEMFPLLWAEGRVAEALALEGFWNELLTERRFTRLCCFPLDQGSTHAGDLERLCAQHTAVLPTVEPPSAREQEARRRFEAMGSAAAAARQFVRESLAAWDRSKVADAAELVVSELVGNAIRHSRGAFVVVVRATPQGVHVAVTDASCDPPRVREADDVATGGRGLHLVAAVSQQWGTVHHDDAGKTVWAEIVRGS